MVQLIKWPTPDFISGRDLMILAFGPQVGLTDGNEEPAWDSLYDFNYMLYLKNKQTNKQNQT